MGNAELGNASRQLAEGISRRRVKGFAPIHWSLVQEYLHARNDPEIITSVWRALLPNLSTPKCGWKADEIAKPVPTVKGGIAPSLMVPDIAEYNGAEGLVRLVKDFSLTDERKCDRFGSIESYKIPHTFVKIEASVNAPNLYTSENDILDFMQRTGLTVITAQIYMLGGLFTKKMSIEGEYFDEHGTISDIGGSHDINDISEEATIRLWFLDNGIIGSASPHRSHDDRQPLVGRRIMEVPHAANP